LNTTISISNNTIISDNTNQTYINTHYNNNNNNTSTNSTDGINNIEEEDVGSANRYRDSEELRYSLRSLVKNAPWIRKIYIVTDNQIPYWLNLENERISIISHQEIFLNKSHLPVFSSPAIEANIHRIPGLSKQFIYFNDDVFLGSKTHPDDFVSLLGIPKFYLSWEVPKCASGCSDSWIGDGYCDKACNVSACDFDFPDCVNSTLGITNTNNNNRPTVAFCARGCPHTWLGDKVCDLKCKSEECGWDLGINTT
jgi:UDP-N-acetylglucosamine-lysosomal-enzyme